MTPFFKFPSSAAIEIGTITTSSTAAASLNLPAQKKQGVDNFYSARVAVNTSGPVYLNFGGSTVNADGVQMMLFPNTVESFGLPSGATHVSARSATGASLTGVVNISVGNGP